MNKSFCLFERFATRHRKEVVDIFLSWRLRQQKERRRVHLTRLLLDGIELVLHSTLKIIKPIRHTHADSLKKGEVGKTIDYATKEREQQLARRISLLEGTIAGVFWQVLPGLEETKKSLPCQCQAVPCSLGTPVRTAPGGDPHLLLSQLLLIPFPHLP